MDRIRVRFAPSPTGFLHVGSLRTALYNELLARHSGGDFILRVEDTDRSRYVEGAIENLCRSLKATGVIPNEGIWLDEAGNIIERGPHGPYLQSQRKDKHLAYAQQLIQMDRAYYCFCTAERLDAARSEQQAAGKPTMYDRHCRGLDIQTAQQRVAQGEPHVVRLKLPLTGEVTFSDIIRGQVTFQWADVDDQVIIKSDGFPTYHLAAMCDDHDMMITHVIRAEEWISSTPKHLFIYESFGWKLPAFAHLPLLLNADRSKLSKRQGDVAVEDYLSKGYLPEVLLNFVALLGWNPSAEQEIYTHEELIAAFDLSKVNKAGAIFNIEKLDWLNAQYMKALPEHTYLELTRPHVDASPKHDATFIDRCLLLVRDRVVLPSNVKNLTNLFFQEHLEYQNVSLTWKTQPKAEAIERLEGIRTWMEDQSEAIFMDAPTVEQCLRVLMIEKEWGNGDTLWPLRVTLSAQEKSPGPFDLLVAYGKERSLARLNDALKFLSPQA